MMKGERLYDDGISAELRYYRRNREKILQKRRGDQAAAARAKRYRENNFEKVLEAARKRRIATKELRDAYFEKHKDRISAQRKARYQEDKNEILAKRRRTYSENANVAEAAKRQAKEWAERNRERVKEQKRAYAIANPDKLRVLKSAQRARKRNAKGRVSSDIVKKLMLLQRDMCACCRCDLTKAISHLDHIEPLALGGAHDDKNMQLLCKPCNLSKHAKHPVDFMQSRGYLL